MSGVQVVAAVKAADPMMKQYLKSIFSLSKGQYPHKMVF